MAKQKLTPDVIVKIEKSGNRYNAWDTDGVKRTSEITSGCRKNAYNGNYLLGRFPSPNSKSGFSWRKVSDAFVETATPVAEPSSVEVKCPATFLASGVPASSESVDSELSPILAIDGTSGIIFKAISDAA